MREMDYAASTRSDSERRVASERLLSLLMAADREIGRVATDVIPSGVRSEPIPLSYAQERLWFLDQLGLAGAAYNMCVAYRMTGAIDVAAIKGAFSAITERHEILRTRYVVRDGVPYQKIDPPGHIAFHQVELTSVTDRSEREERLLREIHADRAHRFDLSSDLPMRVSLVRLGDREHALVVTIHHIAFDGWSIGILMNEISELYSALLRAESCPLPPMELQYADYALWQRGRLHSAELQAKLQYWRERLLGAPSGLQLPADRARPPMESFRGAQLKFDLSKTLYDGLRRLAVHEGATLFMVCLAAYQVLLARWSGQRDIVIGAPMAGRDRREVEALIGFFVNTLVLRLEMPEDMTFGQLLQNVRETTIAAYSHQEVPLEKIVIELSPERNLARQPLFQVTLALQNFPSESLRLPGVTTGSIDFDVVATQFDLTLYLYEDSDRFSATFCYATDLFDRETIQRLASHYRLLLESIVADPNCHVSELHVLDVDERRKLLVEWNETKAEYPHDKCVHDLFYEQVRRTPGAVALVFKDQQLTYEELDRRSNQLAHYLRNSGVAAESIVGLCIERSVQMIVGMLGILKAGGAYLPLDASYPAERLRYMLKDSDSTVLLTTRQLSKSVSTDASRVRILDDEQVLISHLSTEAVDVYVKSDNLAYVIYTSGSSGLPKGVGVSHRALCSHMSWMIKRFALTADDSVLLKTPFSFDASVWEIFAPLLCGARVVVAAPEGHKDPTYLCDLIERAAVSVLQMVPSMLQLLVAEPGFGRCKSLRILCSGGEPLRLELRDRVFEKISPDLYNLYGPTETCIQSVVHHCIPDEDRGAFGTPIGRPVNNTQVYLLDPMMHPVPTGAIGELFVGGVQLSRGYLRRPELTSERFVANPFGDSGSRLYRTGDLVRYRNNGILEIVGRIDTQVKIRGYRVELREVEAILAGHPAAKQVAVVARESDEGEYGLVAYVIGDRSYQFAGSDDGSTSQKLQEDMVSEWETLHEETYATQSTIDGPNFVGWNSSYDGAPIPETEMQEWLACTVERIRNLGPRRVLEIGCGVGLILQHIAPLCDVYVGADFSSSAIDQLQHWMRDRVELQHVKLQRRSALQLEDVQPGSFDTIILNSVVQYFPDIEYLRAVLQEAFRLLSPGGRVFVGDIRNFCSLRTFHTGVQFSKATASVTVGQLKKRIARAITHDKELVIAPAFFDALLGLIPDLGEVRVLLKRGEARNELTSYRYDVVMSARGSVSVSASGISRDWNSSVGSVAALEDILRERAWPAITVRDIPNIRSSRDLAVRSLIDASDESVKIGTLRRQLEEEAFGGVDPESVWVTGERCGYDVVVSPSMDGSFNARFSIPGQTDQIPFGQPGVRNSAISWSAVSNDPLENAFRQKLIPELRGYLSMQVPEHMIPHAWVISEQLPLTPSGKLDRRALPPPLSRDGEVGEYIAPRTELECSLAIIWGEVLRVDHIGMHDNFFDLGGHSLLVIKALSKINQRFRCNLKVVDVYRAPTLSGMVAHITGKGTDDEVVDLSRESLLPGIVPAEAGRQRRSAGAILLTGATGFVGRFLLAQLLKDTDALIYCLVRGDSEAIARSRLRATLVQWGLWADEYESRVREIPGDLSRPQLGVGGSIYHSLSRDVEFIFHCGTSMNHLETYAMARPANVESVRELLRLATNGTQKVINYISTLGVFSSSYDNTERTVDEGTSIDYERHLSVSGYVASKWVAEKMFLTANERGIPCNVFRVGLVWADSEMGRYDDRQREYRLMKSCLLSGFGIRRYACAMPPTPVDHVARSVVFLAAQHQRGSGVFHISSSGQSTDGVFEVFNEVLRRPMTLLPIYEWLCEIKRLHRKGVSLPIVPLIEATFSMKEEELYEFQRNTKPARYSCSRTNRELQNAGISLPDVGREMVHTCVRSMVMRDPDLTQIRVNGEDVPNYVGIERQKRGEQF